MEWLIGWYHNVVRILINDNGLLTYSCALGAKKPQNNCTQSTIYMVLRCPISCVQNKFLFGIVVQLGGTVLSNKNFKRIYSPNMVVSLNHSGKQLTLDDLNNTFNEIKCESENKIFFEAIVSMTTLQKLFVY